jgi:GMP synthase-like glutamine amidotransferase
MRHVNRAEATQYILLCCFGDVVVAAAVGAVV